jgi:hypothetical protein
MSASDERDLMNRLTREAQIFLALGVVVLLVVLIVGAMQHPQGGGGLRGQGAVPGQAAGANARRPPAPADHGDNYDWVVVAVVAVVLTLSVFSSRLTVNRSRRKIAAGTWYSLSRRWVDEDGRLSEKLRHPAIRSDRGQLAYVWSMQTIIGAGLLHFPLVIFAANAYKIPNSPIALAAVALLACAYVAWFPTRTGVANWIERQEAAVIDERQAAGLHGQPSSTDKIVDSTSDDRAPTSLPAESPLSTQTEMFAPHAWNNARKHIAFAVFWNAFTGFWIYVKLYGEHPRIAGWQGWLFLTPFMIAGIVLIALTVDSLIRALKITRFEKSSRSRRTRRSSGSQIRN